MWSRGKGDAILLIVFQNLPPCGEEFQYCSEEAFLRGLAKGNQQGAAFTQKRVLQKIATLDQDATLVETVKQDA